MATIAIGCAVTRKAADRRSTSLIPHSTFLVFFLFLISFVFTASRVATAQWWIHFFLLTVFAWTLIRARVSSRTVATWFVISLLPHAFLGIWQYASQEIVAMTWFGIAAQDPSVAGVSVVEAGPMRVLRAYGGFPHPNIFGGWLAMGYVAALVLAREARTKARAVACCFVSATLSVALFLTFARGAWIAAAVGIGIWLIDLFRTSPLQSLLRKERNTQKFVLFALTCSIFATGIVAVSQRQLLLSRLYPVERLERKSLDTRRQSLKDGWQLFLAHPMFGTGPNAELVEFVRRANPSSEHRVSTAPIEPPHNAFLLALVDMGIVGMILLGLVVARLIRRAGTGACPFGHLIVVLAILALFDHYLWSLWAGQALVAFTVLLTATSRSDTVAADIV